MAHDEEDTETFSPQLTDAERRVVDRLRRARIVADTAAPDLVPTFEDLLELDELLDDERYEEKGEE